ncbi:Uncharacterised protein [uncultured archaeon]|nr:Uncharacterised protein [uncultured archaeon]
MASVKDTVTSVFIKNFIIPKAQVLDQPGFIIFKMGGKSKVYSRQIIFPESFLVDLETQLVEKYGDSGREALYLAGKKFGYLFASMGNFFSAKNFQDNKKLVEYVGLLNNFIEGTYAKKMTFEADLNIPKVDFFLDNFISCNKSGLGYFLPTGAAAGLLCYLLERDDIEGVQTDCQGNGSSVCKVVYSIPSYFSEKNIKFIQKNPFEKVLVGAEYANWNKTQPTKYSQDSFQKLLNSKFFSYSQGIIEKDSKRYFIFEASGPYIIENELSGIKGFTEILLNASVKEGENLFFIGAKNIKGLSDLLTAFGWGDVFILKKADKYLVNIDYYPWTLLYERSDFIIIQGILQGALSKIDNRPVSFSSKKKNFNSGGLSVSFFE